MINLTAEKKINTLRVKLALPSYIWKFDGKLLYEYKTPEGIFAVDLSPRLSKAKKETFILHGIF